MLLCIYLSYHWYKKKLSASSGPNRFFVSITSEDYLCSIENSLTWCWTSGLLCLSSLSTTVRFIYFYNSSEHSHSICPSSSSYGWMHHLLYLLYLTNCCVVFKSIICKKPEHYCCDCLPVVVVPSRVYFNTGKNLIYTQAKIKDVAQSVHTTMVIIKGASIPIA